MKTGICKFFNPARGFGFITPADGGPDVFVHVTDIQHPRKADLVPGDPVEFEIGQNDRGPKAINVSLLRRA